MATDGRRSQQSTKDDGSPASTIAGGEVVLLSSREGGGWVGCCRLSAVLVTVELRQRLRGGERGRERLAGRQVTSLLVEEKDRWCCWCRPYHIITSLDTLPPSSLPPSSSPLLSSPLFFFSFLPPPFPSFPPFFIIRLHYHEKKAKIFG